MSISSNTIQSTNDNSVPPAILNQSFNDLEKWLATHNIPSYKAKQIIKWVHKEQVLDPNLMSDLSKILRQKLSESFNWDPPDFSKPIISKDGCIKWLLNLPTGNKVETVFIPEKNRGTLCISSQSGCALACTFCSTGAQGFSGNLTSGEIIGQVWFAKQQLLKLNPDQRITNVVFMGMGEPLLNFKAVVNAIDLMVHDLAYGLSKYKVTLSTSGIVPKMYQLQQLSECALAVSLHAATNELRNTIMPINIKHPLEELIACCNQYFSSSPKRKITFEYAMLKGINDHPQHAKKLTKLLANCQCKINLIPFNPFPKTQYQCSDQQTILNFQRQLQTAGFNTTIRKTRGQDIEAACGQLAGDILDMTPRTAAGRARRALKKSSHTKLKD